MLLLPPLARSASSTHFCRSSRLAKVTPKFLAGIRGVALRSVRYPCRPGLAVRTLPLEDVRPVCAVDVAAFCSHTDHAIRDLAMISSGYASMASAQLVVPVDIADLCGVGIPAGEQLHDLSLCCLTFELTGPPERVRWFSEGLAVCNCELALCGA